MHNESTLRTQTFTGSIAMRTRKEKLSKLVERDHFSQAMELANSWKKEPNFVPDLDVYNLLIQICSVTGLPNEASAFFSDMLLMDIQPDVHTFNFLLRVSIHLKLSDYSDKYRQRNTAT